MKVGTDGTLLGTWVDVAKVRRILDVGTGTGLIALMLAQRTQRPAGESAPLHAVEIDAVEIDVAACEQAQENIGRSPWCDRIQVYPGSIQAYVERCDRKYDLIVANPPFFENVSKAKGQARTVARHNDSLSQADLLQVAVQLLQENGRFAVIYPCEEAQRFQEKAIAAGFFCQQLLSVRPTVQGPTKRILMEFSQKEVSDRKHTRHQQIAIEQAPKQYTDDFIALIQDFYLKY